MTDLYTALDKLDQFLQHDSGRDAVRFFRGVEREALRVNKDSGRISKQPHPKALGSALTHGAITTDYSEALMEFITGVYDSVEGVLGELNDIHLVTNHALAKLDECLWPGSMPCHLEGHDEVPIAYYGESNVGQLKRVYREGLSNRYGRIMQCIAGMHYNFSFSETFWDYLADLRQVDVSTPEQRQQFKSEQYFALIRNFRRKSWLLSLLFGASPAIDSSFLPQKPQGLAELGGNTWVGHGATSLRMSDMGYQNKAQAGLYVCYNEVDTYIKTIKGALRTPYEDYERIGLKVDGKYRQLSTNLLQIENEYYSDIRPKRVTLPGEHPSAALQRRGVEYIEVRIMDIDPCSPIGMQKETLYFLDVFLMCCMLHGDERMEPEVCRQLRETQQAIATHGRELERAFDFGQGPVQLKQRAQDLLGQMETLARFLSEKTGNGEYLAAVLKQEHKLEDISKLPASKVETLSGEAGSYQAAMLKLANQQMASWLATPIDSELAEKFAAMAEQSLAKQAEIEATDVVDFDTFLADYMQPQC
ncbi:glutamate--cysteine ligase [Maribrevibacterium harenarium]|uniref:Glutamate--cysteine ligase n=1 Tax=Maribrevibacterium harenarium TaxID=2589817 RepID=A0A501WXB2_9GAMM|nr:glutamate--cysteine ligase [Maribrevibacterium harenarium]TPE54323.1 glutamate--cysteine ligase [Maribrevibacterium harenarium]